MCTMCTPGACEGRTRVLDSLELEFHGCEPSLWELGLGPLQEQQVHLAVEPFLSSSIALDIPAQVLGPPSISHLLFLNTKDSFQA